MITKGNFKGNTDSQGKYGFSRESLIRGSKDTVFTFLRIILRLFDKCKV